MQAESRVRLAAVEHVADDCMPRVRAVYAQLVRAPGHGLKLDERAARFALDDAQARLGGLARLQNSPRRARALFAADGHVKRQRFVGDDSANDRDVALLDEPAVEVL